MKEVDYNPEFVARMIPKIDWSALKQAAEQVRTVCYCLDKCSKISNTFFLFFNKILVVKAGNYKMLFRIGNRADTDQTASSEAV